MPVNPKNFDTAVGALASGYRVTEFEQETGLVYLMSQLLALDHARHDRPQTVIKDIS